jgi:(1->4)-alpha-D-glucan 1-alpha-D-glucosylmutase
VKQIPDSLYRFQFNKDFTFRSAMDVMDYINELGISTIYASPIWHARKGSMHGYDVVEPAEINPELGSDKDFSEFKKTVKKYGFGWLQDIVPNHMAYSGENQMLIDLLENGSNSRYYNFFDIDWSHPHESVRNRILAPFLGKLYQECLEAGEIKLKYDQNGFTVNYYDNVLPLKMESYAGLLSFGVSSLIGRLGRKNHDIIRYLGVVYFLRALPSAEEIDERYYQIMFVKEILWELYTNNEVIKESLDNTLDALNGKPGDPASFDNLDSILREQNYRLSYWKVAAEEINYRRFFNINELISLRVEDEDVFRRTHRLINKLAADKDISGLRIDHVDGLYNPAAYLRRLREQEPDIYLVVEKILELKEDLPEDWPVDGTTGYEYLNFLNGLFVKHENARSFTSIYQRFTKRNKNIKEVAHEKKRLIIRARMAGEVERLAYLIEAISSKDRYGIDITMHALKGALEEILTYFPVYRTYINRNDFSGQDKKYINHVLETVKNDKPKFVNELNYIGSILKMEFKEHISEHQRELALDFNMKFQQLTGPLMAKGFEDTALYVYNRFISLNEVGGDPGHFGIKPGEYHSFILKRLKAWPHSMNTLSTHDTKRGEDVRARLNVISEIPVEWDEKVRHWNKINKKFKKTHKKINVPERNDEYSLYQNIIGAFPFDEKELPSFRQRMKEYMVKAVREAKEHTAWIKPDEEYENYSTQFIESILTEESEFLNDLQPFIKKVSFYGVYNSIAQTILKFTSPGVPDVYQGTEVWNLSLVDPDNRRPVDYPHLRSLLKKIKTAEEIKNKPGIIDMLNDPASGMIKFYITNILLRERKRNPLLFSEGSYTPIYAEGELAENVIAFKREYEGKNLIVITGRFFTNLVEYGSFYDHKVWKDTFIKGLPQTEEVTDLITCNTLNISETGDLSVLLKDVPFAVFANG